MIQQLPSCVTQGIVNLAVLMVWDAHVVPRLMNQTLSLPGCLFWVSGGEVIWSMEETEISSVWIYYMWGVLCFDIWRCLVFWYLAISFILRSMSVYVQWVCRCVFGTDNKVIWENGADSEAADFIFDGRVKLQADGHIKATLTPNYSHARAHPHPHIHASTYRHISGIAEKNRL